MLKAHTVTTNKAHNRLWLVGLSIMSSGPCVYHWGAPADGLEYVCSARGDSLGNTVLFSDLRSLPFFQGRLEQHRRTFIST